uniref:MD-2-related lipid-recognition domain-containing protein n=1 Tax=Stomoxys calcitrans TaxID=35570 RepID=A0A1I8Q606_STOCA
MFVNASWTDNRPDFIVNMTFSDQGSIYSETTVVREIAFPIAKFLITQKELGAKPLTLYNISARLCDISAVFNKVPLIKQAYLAATKQSNLSFDCPLKPGFYTMRNLKISSRNPVWGIMNRPKVSYTIMGGMYEEVIGKSNITLTTYAFTMKVIKKTCRD